MERDVQQARPGRSVRRQTRDVMAGAAAVRTKYIEVVSIVQTNMLVRKKVVSPPDKFV